MREELPEHRVHMGAPLKDIPAELRRRRHGSGAGVKTRERNKRRFKPCLPSIVMGSVRSLANELDELTALVNGQREYRECSLLCLTETWLNANIPDCSVEIAGASGHRAVGGKEEVLLSLSTPNVATLDM